MRFLPLALLAVSACAPVSRETLRDALNDPPRPAPARALRVRELEPGAYLLTETKPWPANALLVAMGDDQLVLVDALWSPEAMRELLAWTAKRYPRRRLLAVNTHFHADRTGGNAPLLAAKVPVYASDLTVKLMKTRGRAVTAGVARAIADAGERRAFLANEPAPADGVFALGTGLDLSFGDDELKVEFPGAGHSPDNVVVWFPRRRILFGGCLVLAGGKVGNASDADLAAWGASAAALRKYGARLVIPGHGTDLDPGNLDRTVALVAAARAALAPRREQQAAQVGR